MRKETKNDPEVKNSINDIGIVYAGGTISSIVTEEGYREGGHSIDLIHKFRELFPGELQNIRTPLSEVAFTGLSENMNEEYLEKIYQAVRRVSASYGSIVITHGTDSMEQTARYLQSQIELLSDEGAPRVIITGANEDISHPQTDAWDNLSFALNSATNSDEKGVFVAFHNRLIPANFVVKEPYDGISMKYASSSSEEYKAAQAKLRLETQESINTFTERAVEVSSGIIVDYPVNAIRSNHQEFLTKIADLPVRAVLLTLYHSGTANTDIPDMSVSKLVEDLRSTKGIVFFGVTENGEPTNLRSYETSVRLRDSGLIPLYNMKHNVALAKLRSLPIETMSSNQLIRAMLHNLTGEIDEELISWEDIQQIEKLYSR